MQIKAILKVVFSGLLLPGLLLPGLLLSGTPVLAEKKKTDTDVKELSGISIIGNKEAPKSLYIVPWQNSEVGVATSINSGLLDDSMRPIDKDVFLRELDFYELSHDTNIQK